MRPSTRRSILSSLAAAAMAAGVPAAAQATGVAYIDGNEVWVSTLDGSQKLRLSNGENDWREVGQNDAGYVVATRREEGKIADLATFTIWRPDGTIKDVGPLTGKTNGGLNTYPLGLELTPDAGLVVYGYSNYVNDFPIGSLTTGLFALPSSSRIAPAEVSYWNYPSLVGDRIVASRDDHTLGIQGPGSLRPQDFTPWPGIEIPSPHEIFDIEVASTARTVALGVHENGDSAAGRVSVVPTPGLGQAPVDLDGLGDAGACWLVAGKAADPTFSPDGASIAWGDARGVVIAGTPLPRPTTPPGLCTLSRPATVISPTGKRPAIGGIDVPAILAARRPPAAPVGGVAAPSSPSGPAPAPPGSPAPPPPAVAFKKLSSLKLSALGSRSGAAVELTPTVSGKATFTLTVDPKLVGRKSKKPVTIATGKATLSGGKTSKVKLRANAVGKKSAKKLKKKQAKLTVKVGGTTTNVTVKLS